MNKRLPRGAPAKYAHHGIVEKVYKKNSISCSACTYYRVEDQSCRAKHVRIPSIGYDYWRYCGVFQLIEPYRTRENLDYVDYVHHANQVKQPDKAQGFGKIPRIITLMNVATKKVITLEVVKQKRELAKGEIKASSAIVQQVLNHEAVRKFTYRGNQYTIIDITW